MSKYKPSRLRKVREFMKKGILTNREREVFELLIQNYTTNEIADILCPRYGFHGIYPTPKKNQELNSSFL